MISLVPLKTTSAVVHAGKTIGKITYSIDGNVAILEYTTINEANQGHGLGGRALTAFIEAMRRAGIRRIETTNVKKSNLASIKMHLRASSRWHQAHNCDLNILYKRWTVRMISSSNMSCK